jgi:hypothetical protein
MVNIHVTGNTEENFWSKVAVGGDDGCWEWQAGKNRWGYGHHVIRCKRVGAHRMAWIYANGEIPDGLHVLHHCDNPGCCNPKHLFLGTNIDNIQDKCRKGRQSRPKGEAHPGARLTEADVRRIRDRAKAGVRKTALAREYGVSQPHISYICSGRFWSHLPL